MCRKRLRQDSDMVTVEHKPPT